MAMESRMTMAAVWFGLIAALVCSVPLKAETSGFALPTRQVASAVNRQTIGVVFTHEELFLQLVHDMEHELEAASGLRIVPVMGKNHVQSVYDLLYLKGIDLALVRADAIEYVRRRAGFDTVQALVQSVAKVSDEKIVILAGEGVTSVADLTGKPVGIGLPGSGEFVTGTVTLESLGVNARYVEIDTVSAIERVKSGELAAMVYLLRAEDAVQTGADLAAATAVRALEPADGLTVVPMLGSEVLASIYRPTALTHADLPALIDEGRQVNSYAVDAILAAYRWPSGHSRRARSARFVSALHQGLDGLQDDDHDYQPSWDRVDLSLATPTRQRPNACWASSNPS